METNRQDGGDRTNIGTSHDLQPDPSRQDQQKSGSVDRQQNQQRKPQDDEANDRSNPGLEESNRIDLDDEGHRDQQV